MSAESIAMGKAIKAEALRLGFSAVGFAKAERVSREMEMRLRQWLANGGNADMAYMANYMDKRVDPRLLMPGLKTIVSVALNYAPAHRLPDGEPQISAYALGQDYHDVVKGKLRLLAKWIEEKRVECKEERVESKEEGGESREERVESRENCRINNNDVLSESPLSSHKSQSSKFKVQCFCDTGPVLERYWAVQAGLGWIGRNHQLIIPFAGSMFFLGELFLDFELPYDSPMKSRCGNCHKCIDACPTGALGKSKEKRVESKENSGVNNNNGLSDKSLSSKSSTLSSKEESQTFNAELCLSYQTIENRGKLSEDAKENMGDTFYGCDRCQQACPWNKFATPNTTPELQPKEELLGMTRDKWKHLSVEDYRRLFKGSAVKRAKYDGLMRNIDNLK